MTWFILPYLALRGFCEGMVMTRRGDAMCAPGTPEEGVRGHRWFKRWYHPLTLIRDGIPMAYIYRSCPPDIAGVLFLGWELSELMYNFARYGVGIVPHENVMGWKSVDGIATYLLHAARIVIGTALIGFA